MKHIKGLSLGLCAMGACLHCIASTWTDENGYVWRYKETGDLFGVELYGDLYRDESALPRSVKGVVTVPSTIPVFVEMIDDFDYTDLPVVEISQDAFYGCKYLTDIEVHPDNLYFTSIDGVLYDYDVSTLIRCPQGKTSILIPSGVREIVAGAFAGCTKLTAIELPETLTYIRGDAFCGCTSISQIEIPASVVAIDAGAFSGCMNLTKVTFNGNAPSVMTFYRAQTPMHDAFGQTLYYAMHNVTQRSSDGAESSHTTIVDLLVPQGYSDSVHRTYVDGEDRRLDISITTYASSVAASKPTICERYYDPNLNYDLIRSWDSYDGYSTTSNIHRAAVYDFAGYSNADFPRTSSHLVQYVKNGSRGWSSNQEESIPEFWCGRPLKIIGNSPEERSGEATGQTATLTVTNVVIHYIVNSVQPEKAIPASMDTGFVNIITEVKSGGAVSVPVTWVANYPDYAAKFGNDFTKSLVKPTGKRDGAGNAMLVWQDYVAGTDPTDTNDVFTASITMVGGVPKISYSHEFEDAGEAAMRKYTTLGKKSLADEKWEEVAEGREADYNFFKVTVEMK